METCPKIQLNTVIFTTTPFTASTMVRYLVLLITLVNISAATSSTNEDSWYWAWTCNQGTEKCEKIQISPNYNQTNYSFGSLAVCRLICGKYGALWPRPTINCILSNNITRIHPSKILFTILNANEEAETFLNKNARIFKTNLENECGANCTQASSSVLTISVRISSSNLLHQWETNEHYVLEVANLDGKLSASITAENVYGARHALETLSQLTASYKTDANSTLMMLTGAQINDKPVYHHRGLVLDTGRNFLPLRAIKRQIDAMAASKMNVFHWHVTDSQSFPLESTRVPELSTYGAYSQKRTYTPRDVKHLLNYAKIRGVRIIMEIDAPAHAGNGWQWGAKANFGNLAVCVNQQPWRNFCIQPPCGQLNPVNNNVYDILGKLYQDILDVIPKGEVFHMGGDEVFIPCWNSSEEIVKYLQDNNRGRTTESFLQLWADFQQRALRVFDAKAGNASTPIMLWSSDLTEPEVIEKYLDKSRYVIETWVPTSSNLPEALANMGYKLIISTKDAWYLDHGFWGSTKYHNWQTVYNNRLDTHPNVLGGEVCMWGELVEESNIDSRVWPRTAAAAERLWANPDTSISSATPRFFRHRERLVTRGIGADATAPRWCYQNEGECL